MTVFLFKKYLLSDYAFLIKSSFIQNPITPPFCMALSKRKTIRNLFLVVITYGDGFLI